jgi:hypothetical protein
MPVSAAERQFLLGQLERFAQADLENLWKQAEQLPSEDFFKYVSDGFPDIADTYNQTAGQLAATWFEESDPESSFIAKVADPIIRDRLLKSAQWALGGDGSQALTRMSGTMQRAVYDGARDTTVLNVEATGSRYVRVARPNACPFCKMLATRSDYTSSGVAKKINPDTGLPYEDGRLTTVTNARRQRTKRKLGSEYHDHCHCQAIEVRSNQTVEQVLNDEQRKLLQRWNDEYDKAVANAGSTSDTKAIMSSWREQDAAVSPVKAKIVATTDVFDGVLPKKAVVKAATTPDALIAQAVADADSSNPSWTRWTPETAKGPEARYRDNCTHCVTANELRRRGYEVEATPARDSRGRNTNNDILSRWETVDGEKRKMTMLAGGREELDRIIEEQWPDGARGWTAVTWRTGGSHIFSVEKINGKAVYLEPQIRSAESGKTTVEDAFNRAIQRSKKNGVRYVRIDDLVPTKAIISDSDPLVRSVSDGVKIRAADAAKAAKALKVKIPKPTLPDLLAGATGKGINTGNEATFRAFIDGAKAAEKTTVADFSAYSSDVTIQDAYSDGWFWYRKWAGNDALDAIRKMAK